LWKWWGPLWIVVMLGTIGVTVREVGWRTTVKCLPGWFALQAATGPITTWWLIREWVIGRHLTSWTGRHGRRAAITPMSARRKVALSAAAAVTAGWIAVARTRHQQKARHLAQPKAASTGSIPPTPAPGLVHAIWGGRRS
jgi:hypothetical protein